MIYLRLIHLGLRYYDNVTMSNIIFLCCVVFEYSTAKNRNTDIITVGYTIFFYFFFNNDTVDRTLNTFCKPVNNSSKSVIIQQASLLVKCMTGWIGREACLHCMKTFRGEKCHHSSMYFLIILRSIQTQKPSTLLLKGCV